MKTLWIACEKYGDYFVFRNKPIKYLPVYWEDPIEPESKMVVEDSTVLEYLGIPKITWDDEPIELEVSVK